MSKGISALILILCLSLTVLVGQAEILHSQDYTDVPGMPTQDSVCYIQILPGYLCDAQPADEYSMRIFNELFSFVYDEKQRPVRFYDELTQEQIESLIDGVNPDILHMSEYMTVLMSAEDSIAHESNDYMFDMLIDVDYVPGQLVVAVIGTEYQSDETLDWHPYLCEVTETGRIIMHIPEEDIVEYADAPVLLNVLTDRIGAREAIWTKEEIIERIVRPSKSEEDLRRVIHYYTESGNPLEDNFKIFTVSLTEEMTEEIERMRLFLKQSPSLYSYFPETIQSEMLLVFPKGTDMESLIAYEIIAIRDENYRDTYGDVAARLQFAVNYSEEQSVVAMLGFPKKDAIAPEWEWTCMRATVNDGGIETIFEQLMLIRLEEEPGLLMIISDSIPENGI